MSHRAHFPTRPIALPESIVQGAHYRFTILTASLLRLEYSPTGTFEDRPSFFALNREQKPVPEYKVVDLNPGSSEGTLEIITDAVHLIYDKRPFSPSGLNITVTKNVGRWDTTWSYGNLGNAHFSQNMRGTTRTLDGVDGRCELEPGVIAMEGYSYVDDSDSLLFTDDGWFAPRSRPQGGGDKGSDGYFFGYGYDYKETIRAYLRLSGKQPVISRWAFGNWWSRFYKYTAQEYLDLHDRFKAERLPFAVAVIDMDWHIVDVPEGYGSGWTGYTWNKTLFPDPPAFLSELHSRSLKTTLNLHPADGVRAFEDSYPAMAKALGRTDGQAIGFDVTDRKFMDAYFDVLHRKLEDEGIDFWWMDYQQRSESRIAGINNLNVLNHYHFLDSSRDNRRPLTFSRHAGPGSQRYPVGFSGDAMITWDSLDFQPEFTATASNIAFGLWSNDIGGHMFGYRDDELLARWVQLGIFSPIMRLHSSENPFIVKEPWEYGPETRSVMGDYLRLRHRLVPYLYTMNVRNAQEDEMLVQPMYWQYPEVSFEAPQAYAVPNQFMFGSELMVAPITEKRDPKTSLGRVQAWLPKGQWVDFQSGQVYDGDRMIWLYRKLENYPVFMRPGGIVPLDGAETPENGCPLPTELEIVVCVGADGRFDLLEDDGTGSSLDTIDLVKTPISYEQATGTLTIGPCSKARWVKRSYKIRFLALEPNAKITAEVAGKPSSVSPKSESNGIIVGIPAIEPTDSITITVGPEPSLEIKDPIGSVFEIISKAQIHFELKERAWQAVKGDEPVSVKISNLQSTTKLKAYKQTIECPEGVLNAMLEPLLADHRVLRV